MSATALDMAIKSISIYKLQIEEGFSKFQKKFQICRKYSASEKRTNGSFVQKIMGFELKFVLIVSDFLYVKR